jgi:signal transduction histidine kinase
VSNGKDARMKVKRSSTFLKVPRTCPWVSKGDQEMRDHMVKYQIEFQKILNEIERIRWEVERIEKNVRMARSFAEEIFQNKREILKMRYSKKNYHSFDNKNFYGSHNKNGNSCVFVSDVIEISLEDINFIKNTECMDLIFKPLIENNPCILFAYIISKRGVTRGHPYKDFSNLPKGFDVTQQSFFFIADEKHNPERKAKWTEPYLCALIKTWMVTCCSPVWLNSNFIGVLGIDVNLGKIFEPLDRILKMTGKGYALLISPHGNLIVSSDEGMNSLREDGIWIEGKSRTLKWRNYFLHGSSQDRSSPNETHMTKIKLTSGQKYLLHSHFETTGWNLMTILHEEYVGFPKKMVPLKKEKAIPPSSGYQPTGVYLPLMSFISSFSKSLQQIEKLIEGTKMIGKGVLDHPIKVTRNDKIGLLALSINKMAKELKEGKEEFESAYKKVSQSDRLMAIGRLSAGVAHEINNPLGTISSYVQMLLKNSSLDRAVRDDLLLIEEEIQKMSEIIKGLLNFSRESAMGKSPIDLNEVLRKVVLLLKFQLRSKSIQVIERYNDHLPLILGDSSQLQQAFLNILLNSIQAMAEGGELKLRTDWFDENAVKKRDGRVMIEFSDTGIGIDAKNLDKIFDPFFTTKGIGGGTGLGLSISYGIMKEHGGNIDIESKPGKGTLVKVALPALRNSQPWG